MTRPSLAGIEKRIEDVRRNAQYGNGSRSRRLVNEASAADAPALTAAVRDVLKMAAEWEAGAPDRIVGEAVASDIRAALTSHLDLTDTEGEPT